MATFTEDDAELTPARVKELLDAGETQLVDVREAYEHEAGRIAGARHVDLERLTSEADSVERDRPVVFYCRSGARSAMATQAFRASGWEAFNLAGGLLAWAGDGLPLEPDDGTVADH